jgi:hypothetical protein
MSVPKPIETGGVPGENFSLRFILPHKAESDDWAYLEKYLVSHRDHLNPNISFHIEFDDPSANLHWWYVCDSAGRILSIKDRPTAPQVPLSNGTPTSKPVRLIPLSYGLDGAILATNGGDWTRIAGLTALPTLFGLLLTIVIGRRMGWEKSAIARWSAACILLGLYTPAIICLLYSFPMRKRCFHCGKERVVNRMTCEHCGTDWPLPTLSGLEIFELIGETDDRGVKVGR